MAKGDFSSIDKVALYSTPDTFMPADAQELELTVNVLIRHFRSSRNQGWPIFESDPFCGKPPGAEFISVLNCRKIHEQKRYGFLRLIY
jgi:hypothetical protein